MCEAAARLENIRTEAAARAAEAAQLRTASVFSILQNKSQQQTSDAKVPWQGFKKKKNSTIVWQIRSVS